MSGLGTTDSPQLKLVHSLIEAFGERNVDGIGSLLHKDHRRIYHPQSLGKSEQTKEEWLKQLGDFIGLWTDCKPEVHSIIETPGKVVVHGTNRAKTSIGVDMVREMILIIHIAPDEDGSLKVKILEEFTDSKSYFDFFQDVAAAKVNKAA